MLCVIISFAPKKFLKETDGFKEVRIQYEKVLFAISYTDFRLFLATHATFYGEKIYYSCECGDWHNQFLSHTRSYSSILHVFYTFQM